MSHPPIPVEAIHGLEETVRRWVRDEILNGPDTTAVARKEAAEINAESWRQFAEKAKRNPFGL